MALRVGAVGIFWGVLEAGRMVLVADTLSLEAAERYGEHLTYPGGHAEHWATLARLGPAGLCARGLPSVIASDDYDAHPRGRVVYHVPTDRFTVYADRVLQEPAFIACIARQFALPVGSYDVRGDPHYRSGRDALRG